MKEYVLYIILISFHIFFLYHVENAGNTYYNNRTKQNKTAPKVYDIGHRYIPDLSHIKALGYLNDLAVIILPLMFGKEVTGEFVLNIIPIFIIRHIFNSITILPKHKSCNTEDIPLLERFITGGCYDKIFSGHFATLFLLSLILIKRGYDLRLLGTMNFIHALVILSLRHHYTIDIVVAGLVTYTVYNTFEFSL